jgi:hypothetical protein
MDFRLPAFAILSLLLLFAPITAADDSPAPGLRAFCQALLNVDAKGASNSSLDANATPAILQNFTLGGQHNMTLARLLEANASVSRMRDAGLPYLRASDLLDIGWQWYGGQEAIELSGGTPEYGFALQKADEITALEQGSFAVSDDLTTLSARMDSADPDVNLTATRSLMQDATQEFRDGRLAEAQALIDRAYGEVTSAESQAVHSRTMVESARRNIESFLADNWKTIAGAIVAVLAISFIFQKQIRRFLLNARLKSVMREREVVASMMKSLQQDYFQKKTINDLTFHVKTKKYGDIVRNINRQIPLIKEELKRI